MKLLIDNRTSIDNCNFKGTSLYYYCSTSYTLILNVQLWMNEITLYRR